MLADEAKSWVDEYAGWIGLVGVALAVVSPILAFVIYRLQEKSKIMGWELISSNRIIQLPEDQLGNVIVTHKASEDRQTVLKRPNIIVIRVGNPGKLPVQKEDFDHNVTIDFESELVAYSVTDMSDPLMEPMVTGSTTEPNRISLKPLLFNKGDWIDIQCITDGGLTEPKIQARIAGQTRPIADVLKAPKGRFRWLLGVLVLLAGIGVLLLLSLIFPSTSGSDTAPFSTIAATVFGAVVAGLAVGVFSRDTSPDARRRVWRKKDKPT